MTIAAEPKIEGIKVARRVLAGGAVRGIRAQDSVGRVDRLDGGLAGCCED